MLAEALVDVIVHLCKVVLGRSDNPGIVFDPRRTLMSALPLAGTSRSKHAHST